MKVAIIIPTMNRPDFILRQLRFYELMNSPHPVYLSDSSNEENAQKIKEGIKQFKNFPITYQWAPPGKDHINSLLPQVNEKYCIQIGDDDILIPDTISECAGFLENHSDYSTCAGKQVNIRFKKEDYNKSYGIIEYQTQPMGRSIEDEDMLIRAKNYWFNQIFLGLAVRRIGTEKLIRNITKNFFFMGDMTEFLIMSILITAGKSKSLDKLGQIMQISNLRSFDHSLTGDFKLISEQWGVCEKGFSEAIREAGLSEEESLKMTKRLFILYLAHLYLPGNLFFLEKDRFAANSKTKFNKQNLSKRLKRIASNLPFLKSFYYKLNPPKYVNRPESRYYNDFKIVKDFLENNPND